MGHFSKQAGGCGNERTRRLKATKPCNQFLSSTLAIHLVLQSRLEFPNTLTGESQPLHPMHAPNPRCYGQHLARNTLPALTYSKTKETREKISPHHHCLLSSKIATVQTFAWDCSRPDDKSIREWDVQKAREWGRNDAQLTAAPSTTAAGVGQPSFEIHGWKLLLEKKKKSSINCCGNGWEK